MTATQAIDRGKRIRASYPGDCAECGGTIEAGDEIYFSRATGSRHARCVDSDNDGDRRSDHHRPAPPNDAAPRAPTSPPRAEPGRPTARDDGARALSLFDAPRAAALFDAPRAAARDDGPPAAARDDASVARAGAAQPPRDDAYVAPARDSTYGQAGDRDAARRELAAVLELVIAALDRIKRLLV